MALRIQNAVQPDVTTGVQHLFKAVYAGACRTRHWMSDRPGAVTDKIWHLSLASPLPGEARGLVLLHRYGCKRWSARTAVAPRPTPRLAQ